MDTIARYDVIKLCKVWGVTEMVVYLKRTLEFIQNFCLSVVSMLVR